MDEMRSMNDSLKPEVRPRLSPSRFVKVFVHGVPIGRKIDLSIHNNYDSLSFTLKRLGNNYSMSSYELNGTVNNEQDGALDDNDFILLYDNVDGDRFLLGEVPWELFTISVKKIYIFPAEKEDETEEDEEEETLATAREADEATADGDVDEDRDEAIADDGVAADADE